MKWLKKTVAAGKFRLENDQGHVLHDDQDKPIEFGPQAGGEWTPHRAESGRYRLIRDDGSVLCDEVDMPVEFDQAADTGRGQVRADSTEAMAARIRDLQSRLAAVVPGYSPGDTTEAPTPTRVMSDSRRAELLASTDLGRAALASIRAGQLDPTASMRRLGLAAGDGDRGQAREAKRHPRMSDERMAELLGRSHDGREALKRVRSGELDLDQLGRQVGLF